MTLDPWTVYFVMQADSIRGIFEGIAISLSLLSIPLYILTAFCFTEVSKKAGIFSAAVSVAILLLGVGSGIASGLFPTTKTAATVLLLPAIVNNEAIQDEASELYQIAKQALREVAGEDDPTDEVQQ